MSAEQALELLGENGGVAVRVLAETDAPALLGAISRSRDHLRPWFNFVDLMKTEEDAVAFTRRVQKNVRESGRFWAGIWQDECFCGSVGLTRLDDENRQAEFGIWLAHDCTGRGTASLAASVVLNTLFRTFKLHRVSAQCAVGNDRSIALMERLGLVREGRLREAEFVGSIPHDLYVYGLLEREWTLKR